MCLIISGYFVSTFVVSVFTIAQLRELKTGQSFVVEWLQYFGVTQSSSEHG